MSEIIDAVDISKGRPPKYPWTEQEARYLASPEYWADGKARRLYRYQDFDATTESFRTMVHRKRRELGFRTVHTKINEADESIQVQFVQK